jgi:hypothetical protein
MSKFEDAFIQCLKDGVYPGPANINERKGKGRFNRLNGRETSERLSLMYAFGVPYMRGNKIPPYRWNGMEYEGLSSRGKIPGEDEDDFFKPTRWIGNTRIVLEPGYRKREIQDPDEPWKLKRR